MVHSPFRSPLLSEPRNVAVAFHRLRSGPFEWPTTKRLFGASGESLLT
jgi:hypothetical protein